jgi:hypothetical protein
MWPGRSTARSNRFLRKSGARVRLIWCRDSLGLSRTRSYQRGINDGRARVRPTADVVKRELAHRRRQAQPATIVCYWPKADIRSATLDVRF